MQLDVIFVLAMLIALVGSAIFLKRIFTASGNRARFAEFGKYAACVTVFLICAWGFVFSNNLLWYGQNPENAQISLNLDATVEESSFLHLLEQLDATATVEDVIALMGTAYEENDQGSYTIRYAAPDCTLNGQAPTFLSFTFNRKRTEILKITWSYEAPAAGMFSGMLGYLEANALGKAAASTATTADWAGLHLEDTGAYLLLQRVF
ncbi:MAG: hypothetical protein IJO31_07215 [Oscillospiraceae bacterium]|nr:hypothetical protein [Oscillospiraceae bacterium]